MRAIFVLLALVGSFVGPAAAQWRQPSLATVVADSAALQPRSAALSTVGPGRSPAFFPLLGGLVGGLAMVGVIAQTCRNTDCIIDPRIPVGVGIVLGVATGAIVELAIQVVERGREEPPAND